MGYEYIFTITEQDREQLSLNPGLENSIENILVSAPYYIGNNDGEYSYCKNPSDKNDWPTTVHYCNEGLILATYDKSMTSSGTKVMEHLIFALLANCGHVEVKDA